MSQWTRRRVLQAGGLLAGAAAHAAVAPPLRSAGRPRALVVIFLTGGLDALLSTDPKLADEVAPGVHLPYGEQEIQLVGARRVGPLFHRIAPLIPRMAILNGVDCATVAHQTGTAQIHQMRRVAPMGHPGILGALNEALRHAPLSEVRFTYETVNSFWPQPVGRILLSNYAVDAPEESITRQLWRLAQDSRQLAAVRAALAPQLAACAGAAACMPEHAIQSVLTGMQGTQLPAPQPLEMPRTAVMPGARRGEPEEERNALAWAKDRWAPVLRDTLYLLRHRLSSGIFIQGPGTSWDSHTNNDFNQAVSMDILAPSLLQFMESLSRERTADGALLQDEVGVILVSELGRFPRLNSWLGKDHFPQHPVMLMGPGIRPGHYGRTGPLMISERISFDTGAPSGRSTDAVPTVDDLGATLLRWFGVERPASLGYGGRPLKFLLQE